MDFLIGASVAAIRANAAMVLTGFSWSEKSRPIVAQATLAQRESLRQESLETALRWIVGLLAAILSTSLLLLLRS
jgi:hypothetical protein